MPVSCSLFITILLTAYDIDSGKIGWQKTEMSTSHQFYFLLQFVFHLTIIKTCHVLLLFGIHINGGYNYFIVFKLQLEIWLYKARQNLGKNWVKSGFVNLVNLSQS